MPPMDAFMVLASLVLAGLALSRGRWLPLIVFDAVGVLLGPEYIPGAFGLIAAFNLAYALWHVRLQAGLRSNGGAE